MKKLVWLLLPLIFLTACGSNSKNESKTSKLDDKTQSFMAIAMGALRDTYGLDKVEIVTDDDLTVIDSKDEVNSQTGQKYTNVKLGKGNFKFDGKVYPFDMVYTTDAKAEHYTTLFLESDYDKTKGVDIPLESD